MADCDICSILGNKEDFKFVYEDEVCFAILHESPAAEGHTMLIPKKHSTILEEIDDISIGHIFNVANLISTAIFEVFGAQGTNILVNNGHDAGQALPHAIIDILPRKDNDTLELEWTPKKASDHELKSVQSMIKNYSQHIFSGKEIKGNKEEAQAKKEYAAPAQKEDKRTDIEEDYDEPEEETDYTVKALRRLP